MSDTCNSKAALELMMVMEDQLRDKQELFELLKSVFGLDEDKHRSYVQRTKALILDGKSHWKAKLTVQS